MRRAQASSTTLVCSSQQLVLATTRAARLPSAEPTEPSCGWLLLWNGPSRPSQPSPACGWHIFVCMGRELSQPSPRGAGIFRVHGSRAKPTELRVRPAYSLEWAVVTKPTEPLVKLALFLGNWPAIRRARWNICCPTAALPIRLRDAAIGALTCHPRVSIFPSGV